MVKRSGRYVEKAIDAYSCQVNEAGCLVFYEMERGRTYVTAAYGRDEWHALSECVAEERKA